MDNLDGLTDSELRHRLIQYGFPNVPITSTTRKTLIKKLRNHLNNEKAKLRKETAYVTRYSSDEETDYIKTSPRAKFSASIIPNFRSTISYSQNTNNNNNNNSMPPPKSPLIQPRRATGNFLSRYEDPPQKSPSSSPTSRIFVPPLISVESEDDSDYYNNISNNTFNQKTSNTSRKLSTSVNNYCMTPDRTQLKTDDDYYSNSDSIEYQNENANGINRDSSYTSDFTQRLLKLRGETLKDNNFSNNLIKKEIPRYSTSRLLSQQGLLQKKDLPPQYRDNLSPSAAFSKLLTKLDDQYGFKQTVIPCALVAMVIAFFAILSFMYLTITPDFATTLTEKNTNYKICPDANRALASSSYSCIEEDSVKSAIELVKFIAPVLVNLAKNNKCVDDSKSYMLSAKEVLQLAQKKQHDVRRAMKDLHNMEYLIEENPHWNLNNVDENGNRLRLIEVVKLRSKQQNYFAVLNPNLPFSCRLYNQLQIFFLFIGSLGICLIAATALYLVYKLIANYRKSKQDKINYFIDEIISHLMRKAAQEPENACIVVNHLRDKLIPLHKRKSMEYSWNEAIKYLENNESRIQFEVGVLNGENCKLLKWIDTVSTEQIRQQQQQQHHNQQHQKLPIKKWQSPAFDKTNKIAHPPTQCLKIRQMFDKFEANDPNLKIQIQDAILEKVGSNCRIYDIQLDKQSCCVYLRCASEKDAGIVHNEINGWWFDKRLVSIKFLRLERYLNRFPKSSSNTGLHPSNKKNLSMPDNYNELLEDDDDDDDQDLEN